MYDERDTMYVYMPHRDEDTSDERTAAVWLFLGSENRKHYENMSRRISIVSSQ
jgi:hypothetical protein